MKKQQQPAMTIPPRSSNIGVATITTHRHASKGTNFVVRDVWRENLQTEFAYIRTAIVNHPIVAFSFNF